MKVFYFLEKIKMMRVLLFSFMILNPFLLFSQTHQVCFTFDDLPVVTLRNKSILYQKDVTEKILATLTHHQISAIGFVNAKKLYTNELLDPQKTNLLKRWIDEKMDLGNHTFSHMDFHESTFSAYANDIIKGETELKILLSSVGKKPHYFRHPYLRAGENKEKTDSLYHFLKEKGYEIAPVTIDNAEWIFNSAYDSVLVTNDKQRMIEVGNSYIQYMEQKVKYYEGQSQKLFGRNIKHILLLHANRLNADYLDDLIMMLKKNSYSFISLKDALMDEAYSTPITKFNKHWGMSWLDRWALSKGKKGDFFKDEPTAPDFIMKLAKVEHE
jgi:peptidoglycan/xylan/chitin deacetylase (PgdA/CDA1 family)